MNYRFLVSLLLVSFTFCFAEGQESSDKKAVETEGAPAKEKKNVFTKEMVTNDPMKDIAPEIAVLIEYISLDHSTANQLISEYVAKPDGADEIRNILESMLDKETAELKETVWVRGCSGQRSKTQSILEMIYPTEYDPPAIPNIVGNVGSEKTSAPEALGSVARAYMTSAGATAFECRNVGTTLEMDPVLSPDNKVIDLSLAPEIVERIGEDYFTREGFEHTSRGIEHMGMPVFYTMKDSTQLLVAPGKYHLLGIHTPHDDPDKRILVLLRADLISFE